MLEVSQTTILIGCLCLLSLLVFVVVTHRQRRANQRQRERDQRQKFATKQQRIIHEISERLNRQGKILAADPRELKREPEKELQREEAPRAIPCVTEIGPPETETRAAFAIEKHETNSLSNPPDVPGKQPITPVNFHPPLHPPAPAPEPKPAKVIPMTEAEEVPRKAMLSLALQRAEQNENAAEKQTSLPSASTVMPLKKRGNPERDISRPIEPYTFDADEGLYQHIQSFAAWVAGQSKIFTLEVAHGNAPSTDIMLFFDEDDLAHRNGHWFDLFRPPDLSQLSNAQAERRLYCPFNQEAIESLLNPARQIVDQAEREGSARYQQVLKESALPEFIDFLHDLKAMLKDQKTNQ